MEVAVRDFKGLPKFRSADRRQFVERPADGPLGQPGPDRDRGRTAVGAEAGILDPGAAQPGLQLQPGVAGGRAGGAGARARPVQLAGPRRLGE